MCTPASPPPIPTGTVSSGGITFSWAHIDGELRCRVQAPTTGWVAIGFNEVAGLAGTHLVMGAFVNGEAVVSDRTIVAPGDHRQIEDVGGVSELSQTSGTERDGTTEISFTLPVTTAHAGSHDLRQGTTVHLLLAYSVADEFDHHSRVRRHLTVRL
ncbi:DOMON domain-containing protein [Rubrivirga sp.]|uniref:DOMON domain-containing protein n=1 Tax=Rubrivirga sp. TaxID=1885344 RepID=UPI003C757C0D